MNFLLMIEQTEVSVGVGIQKMFNFMTIIAISLLNILHSFVGEVLFGKLTFRFGFLDYGSAGRWDKERRCVVRLEWRASLD